MACMAVFFLGNSVEGSLVQTGAFEVELNGKCNKDLFRKLIFFIMLCLCYKSMAKMYNTFHHIYLFLLGMPIWSKLKSGRIPQGEELFDIINNQLKLSKSEFPRQPVSHKFEDLQEEDMPTTPENDKEVEDTNDYSENDFDEFDRNEREDL